MSDACCACGWRESDGARLRALDPPQADRRWACEQHFDRLLTFLRHKATYQV